MPNNSMQLIGQAKARVAKWFDTAHPNDRLRSKLLWGVEAIAMELPRRRDWFEVMTVGLDGGGDLPIRIHTQQGRTFPVGEFLVVSTIVPGWGFGWRDVFRDEEVYDILSWFLHYARQYIHRSNVARVLMIAWEEHSRVLHPFGSCAMGQRYGPQRPMLSPEDVLDAAMHCVITEWSDDSHPTSAPLSTSDWVYRNTLDPFLHQGIFHYLRGQDLRSHGFDIEAIVAFDCAIQSVAQFLQVRQGLGEGPTRRQICEALELPGESGELAEYTYFLRNNFGAHAGGWRWWDVGEMLETEHMDEISLLVQLVLSKAADGEIKVRSVDPAPTEWSEWFFQHFEMLWDAVWFERLDRWSSE